VVLLVGVSVGVSRMTMMEYLYYRRTPVGEGRGGADDEAAAAAAG